jgi:hypothetical protein
MSPTLKPIEVPLLLHKFLIPTTFHNPSVFENIDSVTVLYGFESVGHSHCSPICHYQIE